MTLLYQLSKLPQFSQMHMIMYFMYQIFKLSVWIELEKRIFLCLLLSILCRFCEKLEICYVRIENKKILSCHRYLCFLFPWPYIWNKEMSVFVRNWFQSDTSLKEIPNFLSFLNHSGALCYLHVWGFMRRLS